MAGAPRVDRTWRLLVLEDDAAFRRRVVATLQLHVQSGAVGAAPVAIDESDSCVAAQRAMFKHAYDAWILDIWLPDGSALDLLEHARREGLRTPALMVTGDVDVRLANRSQLSGAEIAYKPDVVANVLVFVDRVMGVRPPRTSMHPGRLEANALDAGLSPREIDVLRAIRRGLSRVQVAETLGLSENTVKTMTRRLLAKAEARTASELLHRWRTPLEGVPIVSAPPSPTESDGGDGTDEE
jgi:DNA-binding NarL/FixJ family response regulator